MADSTSPAITATDDGVRSEVAAALGLLTCSVALLPFFTDSELLVKVVRHLMAAALILGIWLDANGRAMPIFVSSIAVLDVIVQWAALDGHTGLLLEMLLSLAFLLTSAGYLIHRLWGLGEVGASTLIMGTGVYFLLGLCWGLVFMILEALAPGSFSDGCGLHVGTAGCRPEFGEVPRLEYFAFVTMTTLGYGDVVPLTRQAQGVAIGAAVTGQLFMAVLIGRLVGSYLAKPAPRRQRGRSRRQAR